MTTSPADAAHAALAPAEVAALRAVAALMIPADTQFGVPGADDAAIFADILTSLGRDERGVRQALEQLDELGGAGFAGLPAVRQAQAAAALRATWPAAAAVLVAVVVRCYYRDDRVMRSLGMQVRPPYPGGFEVEQGDWALLEPVRSRGRIYRDAP